jgi:hypothetical protein
LHTAHREKGGAVEGGDEVLRYEAHCGVLRPFKQGSYMNVDPQQSSEVPRVHMRGQSRILSQLYPTILLMGLSFTNPRPSYMRHVDIPVPMARTLSEHVIRHFRLHALPG